MYVNNSKLPPAITGNHKKEMKTKIHAEILPILTNVASETLG